MESFYFFAGSDSDCQEAEQSIIENDEQGLRVPVIWNTKHLQAKLVNFMPFWQLKLHAIQGCTYPARLLRLT